MLGGFALSGFGSRWIADLPQVEAEGNVPLQPYQPLGQQGLILVLAQLEQRLGGVFLLAGRQQAGQIAVLLQQLGGGLGADTGHPLMLEPPMPVRAQKSTSCVGATPYCCSTKVASSQRLLK